ncbi:phage virion morphogenesis protein [Alcaligenes sp. 13f]|uniref:phage virion morphogenesis protein n=1 Tax=Alcaligenes sp. 13f TaxID=2841924 RepID=UPI001CF62CFA|nr:phage virion morphogenesis protein [Alcaligenes sp. 13f]
MADQDFHELEAWLLGMLGKLEPGQRRAVNRRVAVELRRSQASRIAAQRNPDGTAYTPRQQGKQLRSKKGTIRRRAMFARLRTARYLKAESSADDLAVGFRGRDAMVAFVHQYGELATSNRGRRFRMPQRELLGLTDAELQLIEDAYLRHLEP